MNNFAVTGADPKFNRTLHVGRPNIGDRTALISRLNTILDKAWLTNAGEYVQSFEKKLADMLGVRHCIAMCNATVALEIAIRGMGMSGEVLVPSMTFIATAHALQWQKIKPVFCDIDPATHNIDPAQVERLITPDTTGIVGVHLWGRPCDTEALERIARRHDLKLLFDAAHALGCSHQGRMIGSFGDAEVFSFHATKFVNSFEGGAVTTNNHELASRIRLMKNFGFAGYDNVVEIGTNGKMSEVSAAMGITSLESMEDFLATNLVNYEAYREHLRNIDGIELQAYPESESNYQYIVLELDADAAGIDQETLLKVLHAENVFARRYFYPGCHRMEPYRTIQPDAGSRLPETESLASRLVVLPTGTSVNPDDIACICDIISRAISESEALMSYCGNPLPDS
jgi:dTDP-4-amino-4,6-dideoxygalactose transaminase